MHRPPQLVGAVRSAKQLMSFAGVVAIPTSAFYDDADAGATLVRFAFCKRIEVIDEAVGRLTAACAATA